MIFVASNVCIDAVGRSHPLKSEAQEFFFESRKKGLILVTSAEVLQELLHVYLPVNRMQTLDAALELATLGMDQIIPVDQDMVVHARYLALSDDSVTLVNAVNGLDTNNRKPKTISHTEHTETTEL